MRPDALVFDLDGTLWDAAAATARGWNRALQEAGLPHRVDVAGIRSVSGTPFVRCVQKLLPDLHPASEALLQSIDTGEREEVEAAGGVLYPGVAAGIETLAAVYPLFLVSNCTAWYLEAFLSLSGLRGHFAGWDSNGASGLSKPEMLRGLGERHGLERAVYVGDTQGDREAARAARMRFVFVRHGFGDAREPDAVFDDFGALAAHFLGLSEG